MEELQEAPRTRTALVQLAGGVQKARTVPERRSGSPARADRLTQLGDGGVELLGGLHVAHDRDVLRRNGPLQQRLQLIDAGLPCRWKLAALLELSEHALGRVLRLLDVGLVERVDLQTPPGHGDRDLPQQKDAPEIGRSL